VASKEQRPALGRVQIADSVKVVVLKGAGHGREAWRSIRSSNPVQVVLAGAGSGACFGLGFFVTPGYLNAAFEAPRACSPHSRSCG